MSTGVFLSVLAGMLTVLISLGVGVFLLLLFFIRTKKQEMWRWDILAFSLVGLGIALRGAGIITIEMFDKEILWVWWLAQYGGRVGLGIFYISFYAFTLFLLPKRVESLWLYAVPIIPIFIILVLLPLPQVGMFDYGGNTITLLDSPIRSLAGLISYLSFLVGIGILVWKLIISENRRKKQISFIIIGIFLHLLLSIFLGIFTSRVQGIIEIWGFSTLAPIIVMIVVTISRYQLFQVRKIFAQILILLGVVASMFTIRIALNLQFGTESWGLITVLLIIFVIMAVFLIREVFIRTRKEIQLSHIQQRLEDTIETKNSFMSMASLQLRTPLSVIIGYLSVLLDNPEGKYEMNEATREGLERSYKSAQNLNGIIDDMASAREVNEGEFTLDITDEVNLKELIEDIVEAKQTFFEEQETEVRTEFMGEEFTTYVDKSKLKEALNNLVDNAVYYGDGEVQIRIEQGGKTYKIGVEDNGVGLEPDEINSLFDKFSRGEASAKINPNGSGLGLYLAKTIADKHGGRIEVESEGKGEGSTFTIVLPQRDEPV